ncbi:MAG: hypothetical protein COY58_00100 [Gammaproteobacteria bacterium CG_4_10_14_0_8_um_filter_38_16]|nr:MAG: hypothetical protein COY58_00100 [Gammaproteobacteria bacterium CG_4_10_14_0_8_um_filter_38_16]PJA02802.1 MAG: hypothetical protein COX72_08415 [Gammaproteobacteria bacterium CG_4_10_14_0_2_um_filter_38_22]PJB10707.1 MAG: hypothetical protein CO120_03300 [Gammaproteobacteria bacterium CG_4_9_14_3_um_filter_38_9]
MDYRKISSHLQESSILAFGCSGIGGRVDKKKSIEIINAAFDYGVTHFDVAPSYGYGDAEACLGMALNKNRDKVVIATKVGIIRNDPSTLIRKLKPIAQRVIQTFPSMRKIISTGAAFSGATAQPNQFTIDKIKASVEKSLKDLKTDYIDILFLHDCKKEHLSIEVITFLQKLKRDGKVRTYGLATDIETINVAQETGYTDLLPQFPNNILEKNHMKLHHANQPCIMHSAFFNLDRMKKMITDNQAIFSHFEIGPLQEKQLHELMLSYVLLTNQKGVVICSMLNKSHLTENIRSTENPTFSENQIIAFSKMIDICLQDQKY